ncbi:MAG: tRNA uridine-5-carboxymethylaminomethyl(34) synthesis GTPase MnmE [Planctomycetota bacterium]
MTGHSGAVCQIVLTAAAPAAVAVVRVQARSEVLLQAALAQLGVGRLPPLGAAPLVALRWDGVLHEEAICVRIAHDAFELHTTGSPPVVEAVTARLAAGGVVPYAARSIEERARQALAVSGGLTSARVLLDQAQGALRAELLCWPALAIAEREARRTALLARSRLVQRLLRPLRVLVAGPANAGKSTLVNLLSGREAQLVSPLAGTTRDLVVVRARMGAYEVDLVDGAGLRATPDRLEQAGLELVQAERHTCDVCLWLLPRGEGALPSPLAGQAPCVGLVSRADELAPTDPRRVHAVTQAEPEAARARVLRVVLEQLGLPAEPWPLAGGAAVIWEMGDEEYVRGLDLGGSAGGLEAVLQQWMDTGVAGCARV